VQTDGGGGEGDGGAVGRRDLEPRGLCSFLQVRRICEGQDVLYASDT
jgi:hypothetical protein